MFFACALYAPIWPSLDGPAETTLFTQGEFLRESQLQLEQ
jgi:hypothetical protein